MRHARGGGAAPVRWPVSSAIVVLVEVDRAHLFGGVALVSVKRQLGRPVLILGIIVRADALLLFDGVVERRLEVLLGHTPPSLIWLRRPQTAGYSPSAYAAALQPS